MLVAAFLAVFWPAAFDGFRHLLGAQSDLLPALVVYAAASSGFAHGGVDRLCRRAVFDSFRPIRWGQRAAAFRVGFGVLLAREFVLRDQPFTQIDPGPGRRGGSPLLMVIAAPAQSGRQLWLGWGSLWQWLVMSVGGGVATPVIFLSLRVGASNLRSSSCRGSPASARTGRSGGDKA